MLRLVPAPPLSAYNGRVPEQQRPPALNAALRAGSLEALRAPDVALSPAARDFLARFLYLDVRQARRAGLTVEESFTDTVYRGMAISDGQRRGQFVGVDPRRGVLLAEDPEQFAALCHYFDQQLARYVRTWARARALQKSIGLAAAITLVAGVFLTGTAALIGRYVILASAVSTGAAGVLLLLGLVELIGWHALSWFFR